MSEAATATIEIRVSRLGDAGRRGAAPERSGLGEVTGIKVSDSNANGEGARIAFWDGGYRSREQREPERYRQVGAMKPWLRFCGKIVGVHGDG